MWKNNPIIRSSVTLPTMRHVKPAKKKTSLQIRDRAKDMITTPYQSAAFGIFCIYSCHDGRDYNIAALH